EAQATLPGQQDVVRIARLQVGPRGGRLPVRARRDDEAMERLQAPPARGEFEREPVQQPGVRWLGALQAEVVLRLDEAAAKVLLPGAVHGDAGGERVARTCDPACEV